MSEFKSGDEVLAYYVTGDCEFISGPDNHGMSCVKSDKGGLTVVEHWHIRPKPKIITVEMPKPKWAARPVLSNPERIIVEFDCESDADAALEALKDVINIDPKGVE